MNVDSWITKDDISIAIATLALVIAWRTGHRSAAAAEVSAGEAQASARATQASADAARESAIEAKRSADAAIRGVEIANASLYLQQELVRPKPALRVSRTSSCRWRLTNVGNAAAENIVFLDDDDQDVVEWDRPLGRRLAPGESRDMTVMHMGSPPTSLRFTWGGLTEPVDVPCPDRA